MEQASLSKYWMPALLVFLQAMDAATTLFLLEYGKEFGAAELNPVMNAAIQHHPITFCLIKALAAVVSVWLWTKSTRGAWIIIVFYTLIVTWNVSLCYLLIAR